MELNEVLKRLKKREEKSIREEYFGDAVNYAFKRHLLIMLNEITTGKKRKPTAWNLFVSGYLKKGKTIQDAAKDWNKRQGRKQ